MKQTRINPHRERRSSIHFTFFLLALFIAIVACSCVSSRRPKDPCPERRGMSGYGYGWLKNLETGRMYILAPDGAIMYSYYEPAKRKPIQD